MQSRETSPAALKEPDDNAPGFLAVCPVAEPRRRPCPVAGGDRQAPSRPDRGVGEDAADDPQGIVYQGRAARLRALRGAWLEGVQKGREDRRLRRAGRFWLERCRQG